MGLEDLALFRSISGSTVFYPSDAVSCERAVELAANTKGVCFIRTSRPNTAVIYENNEQFAIGLAKVSLHFIINVCDLSKYTCGYLNFVLHYTCAFHECGDDVIVFNCDSMCYLIYNAI